MRIVPITLAERFVAERPIILSGRGAEREWLIKPLYGFANANVGLGVLIKSERIDYKMGMRLYFVLVQICKNRADICIFIEYSKINTPKKCWFHYSDLMGYFPKHVIKIHKSPNIIPLFNYGICTTKNARNNECRSCRTLFSCYMA